MPERASNFSAIKTRQFARNVLAEYDSSSIISNEWILKRRRFVADRDAFSFKQIGVRLLVNRAIFEDPSNYYPGMIGLGQSIAIGEEQYLLRTLEDNISNKIKVETLTSDSIMQALGTAGSNFHPKAVFVSLEWHNDLHLNNVLGVRLHYDHVPGHPLLLFGGDERPRVFWSNKYVPFKGLIFVDPKIGEWIVKTTDDNWVVIEIKEAKDVTKADLTVKTVVYFNVTNENAGLILNTPSRVQ